MEDFLANFLVSRPGTLVRQHELEELQTVLPREREQLAARVKRIRRRLMHARLVRLDLITAHDKPAANGVVLLLAQHVAARQGGKAHAIGVPRQALVIHEQQLHGLVERDLMPAQEVDTAGGADALQQWIDTVRIDGLRLRTLEPRQNRAIGSVTGTRQGE